MKWLDTLLGRSQSQAENEERAKDKQSLRELRLSQKRVGVRTDRLIEAYTRAEAQRRKRHDAAP